MVTHESRAAAIGDRVLYLADGVIVKELSGATQHEITGGDGGDLRGLTRFSLKSLAGRKLRSALTALAIVLGVAMISGTYVLTDTIDKAFSSIFDESYAGTDVVVSGKTADIDIFGDTPDAPPVDASLLEEIRGLESVDLAMGGIYDELNTKIIGDDGKAVDTQGAPSFGFGIDTTPDYSVFNPLNLLEGRWPRTGERGRGRRRHRRPRGLRRRPDDRDLDARAEAGLRGGRHRPLRRRQVAGDHDLRDLRRRDRADAVRAATGSSTRSPWRARKAPRRSS